MPVARMTMPLAVGLAPPRAAHGLWPAWLGLVLARLAERRELLALGERDLRDIGLTEAEALALARRPLWRP
ncbi:DUF1127 domain-containing protein [Paracraurococcus lichenis]|uniref:DUF1127 domain-containing protein n=1 Tax=Paracraurococcus lichenis TaxID=3064888 RepID=A0ABT9E403_9PROT|nr:DUF1127 domain-containing protein [Paracraurococcus sp. LOR1-02]MDO9710901.1 DUF1127 domain-containing protein [Paracraurococcus sp. LOR1-02]